MRDAEFLLFSDFGTGSRGLYLPKTNVIIQPPDWARGPIALETFKGAADIVVNQKPSFWKKRFGSTTVDYLGGKFEFYLDTGLTETQLNKLRKNPDAYFKELHTLPAGYGFHTPLVLANLMAFQKTLGLSNGEAALCLRLPGGSGHGGQARATAGLIDFTKLRRPELFGFGKNKDETPFGLLDLRLSNFGASQ